MGWYTGDARGAIVVEWIDGKDLNVVNRGNAPTFTRCSSESCIDLTLCSTNMLQYIRDWRILDRGNVSENHNIEVTTGLNQDEIKGTRLNTTPRAGELQSAKWKERSK